MNKGFKKYFKEGIKDTNSTFSNKSNYLRFYLVKLSVLFSTLLIVFRPLFSIFNIRMGKTSKEHGVISISDSYGLANKNTFMTSLISTVIMCFIWLSGVFMILFLGSIISMIFSMIVQNVDYDYRIIVFLLIESPVILLLLGYLFVFPLLFKPISYIIDTNPDLTAGEVINRSIRTMRRTGKRTVFLFNLISILFLAFNVAIFVILNYLLTNSISEAAFYIFTILSILVVLEFIILYPRVSMLKNIALIHLFDDIAYTSNKPNSIKGIDITKVKNVIQNQNSKPVDLFDIQLNQRKAKKEKKQDKKSDIINSEENINSESSKTEAINNEEIDDINISTNKTPENDNITNEELKRINEQEVNEEPIYVDEQENEIPLSNKKLDDINKQEVKEEPIEVNEQEIDKESENVNEQEVKEELFDENEQEIEVPVFDQEDEKSVDLEELVGTEEEIKEIDEER